MVRKIAGRLSLSLLGVLIALLLLEGAARLLYPWQDNFFEPHDVFTHYHIPGARGRWADFQREFDVPVTINSRGLRDREYSYDKPDGAFRILVLGDSFTEAMQVPLQDTTVKRLEELLNQNGGRRFEVINAGVMGWGTDQEFLYYGAEGYKYRPDIVLLFSLPFNDVADSSPQLNPGKSTYFSLEDGELVRHHEPISTAAGNWARFKTALRRYSQLYQVLVYAMKHNRQVLGVFQTLGLAPPSPAEAEIPAGYLIFAPEYPPELEAAWAINRALLRSFEQEVKEHGSRLVVVIWPVREQLYPDLWQETLRAYPQMQTISWDRQKPDRLLMNFLDGQNIPYLYMFPAFQEYIRNGDRRLYFQYDGHPNSEGHQLASRLIYRYLVDHSFIPQP
jgi:hypothetical protein